MLLEFTSARARAKEGSIFRVTRARAARGIRGITHGAECGCTERPPLSLSRHLARARVLADTSALLARLFGPGFARATIYPRPSVSASCDAACVRCAAASRFLLFISQDRIAAIIWNYRARENARSQEPFPRRCCLLAVSFFLEAGVSLYAPAPRYFLFHSGFPDARRISCARKRLKSLGLVGVLKCREVYHDLRFCREATSDPRDDKTECSLQCVAFYL